MARSPPSSTFSRALDRFTINLTDKQKQEFEVCSLSDVYNAIATIQDERGSKNAMRNMARIQGFLEGMDDYRKVIEACLNCTPFMGYVWGPIRFILIATNTWVTSLDIILNAYKEIHERLPSFMRYQILFEENPEMRRALELYFCDILEFHHNALKFLNRPGTVISYSDAKYNQLIETGWKRLFTAFWRTFETRFRCILDSLARHKDLIESEKLTVALVEAQRAREIAGSHLEAMQDIESKKQLTTVLDRLEAPDYQIDHYAASEQRRRSHSGKWIFRHKAFLEWADTHGNPLLYINGIPGAGKTILASHIIDVLLESEMTPTVFFYCKHGVSPKNNLKGLLKALLAQIACKDKVATSYLHDFCCTRDHSSVSAKVEELAEVVLDSQKTTLIVLDGLDECEIVEAQKIMSWFFSRQRSTMSTEHGNLRLMCIGQRTETLLRMLSGASKICLENSEHQEDVREFVEQQARCIRNEFEIRAEVEAEIVSRVSNVAQGMFLFAKLMMENLIGQTSQYDLLNELKPGHFPVNLQNAYERVVDRVYAKGPQRAAAARLIGWAASAKRPLTWGEIQATFFIDPQTGIADFEGRRLRKGCKTLCGCLIDVSEENDKPESEATLTLVHDTARTYLQHNGFLDLRAQRLNTASYCIEYLLSCPFSLMATDAELDCSTRRGYYAFMDYAACYWPQHVVEAADITDDEDALTDSYHTLLPKIWRFLQDNLLVDQQTLALVEGRDHSDLSKILQGLRWDTAARNSWSQLEMRFSRITATLEGFTEDLENESAPTLQDSMSRMYGTIQYRCLKIGCARFSISFTSRSERDLHVHKHQRPFSCPKPHCPSRTLGFPDQSSLNSHLKRSHESESCANQFVFPPHRSKRSETTDIFTASRTGNIDVVKHLIRDARRQDETDPDDKLGAYSRFNNLHNLVNATMKKGSDVGATPLSLASQCGHLDVCRLLVDAGAQDKYSALMNAATRKDVEMLQYFLSMGSIAAHGFPFRAHTVLHAAVECDFEFGVDLLLERVDVDVNSVDSQGDTPLTRAVERNNPTILRSILANKEIDADLRNGSTKTPLMIACRIRSYAMVSMLLATGQVDLNAVDRDGQTPLLYAIREDNVAVIKLLLEQPSIDANLSTHNQNTPLLEAILHDRDEVVAILLATDRVNIKLVGKIGMEWSPLRLAGVRGNATVVKMLLETGSYKSSDSSDLEHLNSVLDGTRSGLHLRPQSIKPIVDLLLAAGAADEIPHRDDDLMQNHQSGETLMEQSSKKRLLVPRPQEFTRISPRSAAKPLHRVRHGDGALQEYQSQMMLMEQRNKERLAIERDQDRRESSSLPSSDPSQIHVQQEQDPQDHKMQSLMHVAQSRERLVKGHPAQRLARSPLKLVTFELHESLGATVPLRMSISPLETTSTIVATIQDYYGLMSATGRFYFEDSRGKAVVKASYESFEDNMYVLVKFEPMPSW